jgi:hypothetical protein
MEGEGARETFDVRKMENAPVDQNMVQVMMMMMMMMRFFLTMSASIAGSRSNLCVIFLGCSICCLTAGASVLGSMGSNVIER